MSESACDRLQHHSAGIMMKLPDAVYPAVEGGFAAQLRIDAQSGAQTEKMQALDSATVLIERAAASVRVEPPLGLAQTDEVAIGITQSGQHGLIARTLYDHSRVGQNESGLLVFIGASAQCLQHLHAHPGFAYASALQRLAPDLQRTVTQTSGTVDPT